jgi:hypothetical protein
MLEEPLLEAEIGRCHGECGFIAGAARSIIRSATAVSAVSSTKCMLLIEPAAPEAIALLLETRRSKVVAQD